MICMLKAYQKHWLNQPLKKDHPHLQSERDTIQTVSLPADPTEICVCLLQLIISHVIPGKEKSMYVPSLLMTTFITKMGVTPQKRHLLAWSPEMYSRKCFIPKQQLTFYTQFIKQDRYSTENKWINFPSKHSRHPERFWNKKQFLCSHLLLTLCMFDLPFNALMHQSQIYELQHIWIRLTGFHCSSVTDSQPNKTLKLITNKMLWHI